MEYSQLKITNQFMFGKIMQDPKLCKQMLEIIFNKKIKAIKYPEIEKEMKATYDSKGIRLDVYIDDDKGTVYNIEMQTQDNDHIPKRTRFYQGTMDINSLQKGMYYSELGENYVIFICNFDLFLYNRYIYTFENLCTENTEIKLNDDFTKQLEDAVIKARNNDDWRVEYMKRLSFFKNRKLKAKKENIEQDGGITRKTNIGAPKHIESTLIIRFAIEMSTVADCEENEYCGYVYNLNAALENGAVKGHYECRNRYGLVFEQRFRSSVRFMSDLNRIVTECNLARYNGESSFVAGLPDNYGALVDIMYASGEHIYASDNASNFIPNNAVKELVELFESHAISVSNWTKMEFSRNHSNWDDCFCVYIRRDDLGDMFAEGYLVSNGEEYSFDEEISISTEAVDALNSMKLSSLPKSEKSPQLPQADDEPVQKLILSYNHREVSKKLDNNTFDHIYNILLTEFIKHQ